MFWLNVLRSLDEDLGPMEEAWRYEEPFKCAKCKKEVRVFWRMSPQLAKEVSDEIGTDCRELCLDCLFGKLGEHIHMGDISEMVKEILIDQKNDDLIRKLLR